MALGLLFLEWVETSCPFQARKAVEQAMQGHPLGSLAVASSIGHGLIQ